MFHFYFLLYISKKKINNLQRGIEPGPRGMATGCCSRHLKPRVMPRGAAEFEDSHQTIIGCYRI
jgi:hypothetical protein